MAKREDSDEKCLERLGTVRRNISLILQYGNVQPFHWNTRGYKCFYCDKQIKDCDVLKKHTLTHDAVDFDKFISLRVITKDIPVKIDISDISCIRCPMPLLDVEDLIKHVIETHNEDYDKEVGVCILPFILHNKLMKCVLCEDRYDNFTTMVAHMFRQHIEHSHICQICGLSFRDKFRLKRHFDRCHISHLCKICDKTFDAVHKVIKHKERIHGIQKTIQCDLCNDFFNNKYQMKVHMGKTHNVEEYRIKCEHCPKICSTKGAMLLHVQSLHSVPRFQCDLCEYKTGIKWMIKLHKRKHYGEKNYVCSICERRFGRSSNLRAHMKVHTGFCGRVCRLCRQGFIDLESLNRHEKECSL